MKSESINYVRKKWGQRWIIGQGFRSLIMKILFVEDVTKLSGSEFQIWITLTAMKNRMLFYPI